MSESEITREHEETTAKARYRPEQIIPMLREAKIETRIVTTEMTKRGKLHRRRSLLFD